ncbi:unnamed protein product [Gadus morhua 'NCC']
MKRGVKQVDGEVERHAKSGVLEVLGRLRCYAPRAERPLGGGARASATEPRAKPRRGARSARDESEQREARLVGRAAQGAQRCEREERAASGARDDGGGEQPCEARAQRLREVRGSSSQKRGVRGVHAGEGAGGGRGGGGGGGRARCSRAPFSRARAGTSRRRTRRPSIRLSLLRPHAGVACESVRGTGHKLGGWPEE